MTKLYQGIQLANKEADALIEIGGIIGNTITPDNDNLIAAAYNKPMVFGTYNNAYFRAYKGHVFRLHLISSDLEVLPDAVQQLDHLTWLDLTSNRLSTLPDWFPKLQRLRRLNLGINNFEKLPEVIFNIKNLDSLSLEHNPLESLPDFTRFEKLKYVIIEDCFISPEIIEQLSKQRCLVFFTD
jgi:Leucine-rich repeat (LRR) protein